MQVEIAQKVLKETVSLYEKPKIQAILLSPRRLEVGKEFTIRLDLVNVSRKPCAINCIEKLIPSALKAKKLPINSNIEKDSSIIQDKQLEPFEVKTIKLILNQLKLAALVLSHKLFT